METTTAKLSKILKSAKDVKTILEENEHSITSPTIKGYLEELLSSKAMKRQDVIRRADLDSNYINQLFNGNRTRPSRNQVLSLAFGFVLNREEADRLLRVCGVGALYPKNKRDACLIHALENGKSIMQTNDVLTSLGLGSLSEH